MATRLKFFKFNVNVLLMIMLVRKRGHVAGCMAAAAGGGKAAAGCEGEGHYSVLRIYTFLSVQRRQGQRSAAACMFWALLEGRIRSV